MAFFGSSYYSSFERTFRILMMREMRNWVMRAAFPHSRLRSGGRASESGSSAASLEERIQERVRREKEAGRYDGPGAPGYRESKPISHFWIDRGPRPAGVKRKGGGLRGSRATRWK